MYSRFLLARIYESFAQWFSRRSVLEYPKRIYSIFRLAPTSSGSGAITFSEGSTWKGESGRTLFFTERSKPLFAFWMPNWVLKGRDFQLP